MASKLVICVLLFAVVGCTLAKPNKKSGKASHMKIKKGYKTKPIPEVLPVVRPCDGVFCGAGRECIVTEEQEPSCQCLQSCDDSIEHLICGSDGVSYPNKCELHRSACIKETKITQVKAGPCEAAPTVSHARPARPQMCFQEDRDVLHKQLVQWLESKEQADGWFMRGKTYLDVVDEYFTMFDESGDEVIDNTEFMRFVEHNETVRNSTAQDENTEVDNQLMRSMCVDALLTEADADFDWRLNKEEFETCLRPDFQPGTKMCSLEGREYADGEEMQNKCNECVCACGNWVCTANACDGDMVAGTDAQEEYDPG
ncbi:follistatin-related protein 1-like [Amphiura filiformis]|uniref:follistatin-related protein 1-like n=1 Tax=Amphiura filiformis TaxID=82378 RepID=UPI003B226D02